jgi:hypothetical protein
LVRFSNVCAGEAESEQKMQPLFLGSKLLASVPILMVIVDYETSVLFGI